jgi:hypothetical protein
MLSITCCEATGWVERPKAIDWQAENGKIFNHETSNSCLQQVFSEKFEILKYKIDREIITLISFYSIIHYAVSIYEHFPLKNTIFKHKKLF